MKAEGIADTPKWIEMISEFDGIKNCRLDQ